MKDYKLYLRDRLIDIDLVTKSRYTECDLTISSIPFREYVGEVYDAIIVDSHVVDTYLTGLFSVDEGVVIHSEIDQILRHVMERGMNALVIDSKAELTSHKILSSFPNALTIHSKPTELHAETFEQADDVVVLAVDKLNMEVRKKLSGTENGLEIQTTAQEIKQALEKATGALPFSAEVQQTWSHKFDKAENALHFQAELQSLCYQLFSDGGMTAMEPYAAPLQVEILYSLGGGASSFALDSTVVEIAKNSFLQAENAVESVVFPVSFLVTYALDFDVSAVVSASVANLCYHYFSEGRSGMEITATLGDIEERYSLGGFDDDFHMKNTVAGHFLLKKKERAASDSIVAAVCDAALNGSASIMTSIMVLGCTLEEIIRRYRLLHEVDDELLTDIDAATLDDLDYVTL